MNFHVEQFGEWFGVVEQGKVQPIFTPGGSAVASHHRELAEQMARDVSETGTNPVARTNMFALQAGYLDFGLRIPRASLEKPILAMWPEDIFVQRPADPELMMPLLALWGEEPYSREEFTAKVRRLPLRHLMVLMQCGAQYHSSVLGLELLNSPREPTGYALGACARYWAFLNKDLTLENGYLGFGDDTGRHYPSDTDDRYCVTTCCATDDEATEAIGAEFPARCPVAKVFVTMRRWAAFPEERTS